MMKSERRRQVIRAGRGQDDDDGIPQLRERLDSGGSTGESVSEISEPLQAAGAERF